MAKNSIDFNALKARTLGSGHDEEAVTVNTRALIDKVLARYSGEWYGAFHVISFILRFPHLFSS